MIWGAPVAFFAALLVLTLGVWWLMDWRYSGIIANRDSEISSLRTQRDEYKDKLQGATPDEAKARIDALEKRLARVAPRLISPEQRKTIADLASVPSGQTYAVAIQSDMSCADCNQYAADFQAALVDAHWKISMPKIMGAGAASPKGVAILTPDKQDRTLILA